MTCNGGERRAFTNGQSISRTRDLGRESVIVNEAYRGDQHAKRN